MSGIVGIINFDGKPVDPRLLRAMTDSMAFRGPDAQETWIGGNVGFGHTMLRTTWEAGHERQPCSLDGQVWITADARIDDRLNLIDKLIARGRQVAAAAPDVELILHAYHVWGEDCVEHLLGDFAFAIWDQPLKRLFCARDQLGIRQFYYFRSGSTFVFSNTLNCVRRYPEVTNRLNEIAIAHFLLFDLNQDPATTTFADINQVPAAHTAIVSAGAMRVRRYWSLPIDEPIFYQNDSDYTDRFRELLTEAVRDRMRTPWVGVFMSGGIDSSTLAAAACQLSERAPSASVAAFTNVFDNLIPDDERYYSGLVAARLGIPIHYRSLDAELLDTPWAEYWPAGPEPGGDWAPARREVYYRDLASRGRVFFYGEGPDNALSYEWRPYLAYLAGRGSWARLLGDVVRHAVAHRRIPLIPSTMRMVRDYAADRQDRPQFPGWLNGAFVARVAARDIWSSVERPQPIHPVHPRGYASFGTALWSDLFNACDAGLTGSSIEIRHPYLDLRLLRYMLAVPALPWCRRKYLMRSAMRRVLPDEVLERPKTPLCADPLLEAARRNGIAPLAPVPRLLEYVCPLKVDLNPDAGSAQFCVNLRPVLLNNWLRNCNRSNEGETHNGYSA